LHPSFIKNSLGHHGTPFCASPANFQTQASASLSAFASLWAALSWKIGPVTPLALSTCWHAERVTDGHALLQEAADLGFSKVELSHNTRYSLWPGILSGRQEPGMPRIAVLHNFCPVPVEVLRPHPNAYEFSDPRPSARRLAERHTLETFEAAAAVGATLVVLHIGSAGPRGRTEELEALALAGGIGTQLYVQKKIAAIRNMERAFASAWPWVEEILLRLGEKAAALGLRLGLECRESMREIPPDDFGHAAAKDWLGLIDHEQHLRRLAPRLIGAHLHDYDPQRGDHLPLGQGSIPFSRLLPLLPSSAHISLELSPDVSAEDVRASLAWWNQNQPARS
jgi:sugar phosphate isomerase/epimerase